jgi:hypothetical protein
MGESYIPGMSVKTSSQSLLIQEMSNQTNGTTENEKTVENTHAKIFFGFFWSKGTAVADKINKADGDTSIDVENQVVLL